MTWIESKQLSDKRSVMVRTPLAQVREAPDDNAPVAFQAQQNVLLELLEVAQAGVFQIRNFPQQELDAVLGVTCGNILFPYLRESISNVVIRGGFPPFFLNHLSFEALYQQRLQQQLQAGAPPAAS